ncbi:DUF397 domain-containing protein [Streptomyces nigra]|uniref:DUF397 domain-containing protein n=1 Tax=Streptomyces nigra TaxID=1827580 RepID=UPI0036B604D9
MNTEKAMPGRDGPLRWFKSSYSSEEGGECIEVAVDGDTVRVRDSKYVTQVGPVLKVGSAAWTALLETM